MTTLTDTAEAVLARRYYIGEEGWEELCERVATSVAMAEEDGAKQLKHSQEFFQVIYDLDFLPNSPCLMNAGTELGQLSACFVLPVPDTLDGIFTAIKHGALVNKTGGGTGYSFSRLRPKHSTVCSTNGVASGPISFAQVFDAATDVIKQGGRRRGANMGVLHCTHPDILEFIDCKRDKGMLNNFNLSVAVTDDFMEKVATGRDYELVDQSTGDAVGALNAAEVFARIIDAAWDNGEPGILFIDAANRANPTPWLGQFEASNPCAEQFLLPYESCNLGSINLGRFIVYDEASGKYIIDWNRLNTVTRTAVRFLDNVVDVSRFPIPEITEMTRKTRKLGLGIMGLHDMLIKLELPYSSAEARTVAAKVMQYVRDTAESESVNLANEKGECPAFVGILGDMKMDRRNAALTSIQPTGTVSMIADCSSGCEPYFALVNRKNVMDGDSFLMVSPLFEQVGKREGWYSNELVAEVARTGTVVGNERVPVKWQRIFACAQDIDVNSHIQMQAALQNAGVDASISKTINMPGTATKEDVRNAYLKGWALGCKGLTVYRDGCRDEQVLTIGERKGGKVEAVEAGATVGPPISCPGKMDLPDVLSAKRYRLEDKDGGTIYVIICFADGGYPVEVFAKFPADNRIEQQEQSTMWSAICRMVSLALRCGVPIGEIIKQLDRSSGHMRDLPAQLSKLFKGFMSATEQGYDAGDCPDCTGGKLVYQEGCMSCRSCGYSKCS